MGGGREKVCTRERTEGAREVNRGETAISQRIVEIDVEASREIMNGGERRVVGSHMHSPYSRIFFFFFSEGGEFSILPSIF